jgi:hypothetical protein
MSMSSLALVLLVGSLGLQIPTEESPSAALARAEALWQERGPKAYRFGIILSCECFPTGMDFRVIGGQVQLPRGADTAAQGFHDTYGTVEKLFAVVRRALAAGGHRIVVKYDSELGYPIWADLDPSGEVIDDELFFRVIGFRELKALLEGLPNLPLQPTSGADGAG